MKTLSLIGSLFCLGVLTPSLQAAPPQIGPVITWDFGKLEQVRAKTLENAAEFAPALARLRRDGERAIAAPVMAVTDKAANAPAPSGDPQDYVSFSTYYWPDPNDPKAPWIKKDGEFNREMIDRYDHPRLKQMSATVTDGALAWWFTGDRRFAEASVRQLRVWFIDGKSRMKPHLEYAQFVPNKNGGKGNAHGLIDTRVLVPMLSAVALLENENILPIEDRLALREWFRAYLSWLTQSKLGQSEERATNNHGIFYDQQVIAYALYIGDAKLAREVAIRFPQKRIASQIEPDGSMPRELQRADGATYSTFNLSAMAQVLQMSRACEVDLWKWSSPDGRSLRHAAQWFFTYLDGKPWTASGNFKPSTLNETIWTLASATGDRELKDRAHRMKQDPAARHVLLHPLDPL